MNTNDLYTEYARCIEMCKGTALEDMPWRCIQNLGYGIDYHPKFEAEPDAYIFAVAIVEDEPVFIGNKVYIKDNKYPNINWELFDHWKQDIANLSKDWTWQPPEPKVEQSSEMKIINDLSHVANSNSLDTQCNMPDFIIGAYLYKSLQALMEANKANGEYFKLSAQEDEAKTQ